MLFLNSILNNLFDNLDKSFVLKTSIVSSLYTIKKCSVIELSTCSYIYEHCMCYNWTNIIMQVGKCRDENMSILVK